MANDARRLGFPFLAGSSVPLAPRFPALEWPNSAPLSDSAVVGYGKVDSFDFHG